MLEILKNIFYYFFGNNKNILTILLTLQFFDVLTGYIIAVKNKNTQSNKFVDGIFKKILCVSAIMVTSIIDSYMQFNNKILILCYNYFIFYEILSLFENYNKLDIKFFNKIKKIIENDKKNKGL